MTNKRKVEAFWSWFNGVASSLAENLENPALLKELDERIRGLDPELSWEVGPGLYESRQLVISPNLDPDLRPKAQEIISCAPVIHGWEFHPARRRKEWDYKLLMQRSDGGEPIDLDASEWEFVLLRYPDGGQELLLRGGNVSSLDADERWQAAAITLESILGEDILLDKITEFELVDHVEPQFADELKPIQNLRETVLSA